MAEPSPPYDVSDLVAYLDGSWRVGRVVEDHATHGIGRFEGTLVCVPEIGVGSSITMREDGVLDWSGMRRPAFRATRLRVTDNPGVGEMFFDDGRFFHGLDLRTGTCAVVHPCAPDTYDGTFTVLGPDEWSYEWWVSGPRKDLRLTTHLTRECPPSR